MEEILDNVELELIGMHMVMSEIHSVQLPEQPDCERPESIESTSAELQEIESGSSYSSSRPAKRTKRSDNKTKVTRFSKLLGKIFNNDGNALPPRLAASEKVKRELSLYRVEQRADLDSNPLQ